MRHGSCSPQTRRAATAPHSAVSELEVVRRRSALIMNGCQMKTFGFIARFAISAGVTISICGGVMIYVRSVGPIYGPNLEFLAGVSAFAAALALKLGTRFLDRFGSSVIITTISIILVLCSPSPSLFIYEITTDPLIPIALFWALVVCIPVAALGAFVHHRSTLKPKQRGGYSDL